MLMFESLALEITAGLFTAVVLALVSYALGYVFGKGRYETDYQSMMQTAANSIKSTLSNPNVELISKARVIVAKRNNCKNELINVSKILNSEIDVLSGLLDEVDKLTRAGRPLPKIVTDQIESAVAILTETWADKENMVELSFRKIALELGLAEKRKARSKKS